MDFSAQTCSHCEWLRFLFRAVSVKLFLTIPVSCVFCRKNENPFNPNGWPNNNELWCYLVRLMVIGWLLSIDSTVEEDSSCPSSHQLGSFSFSFIFSLREKIWFIFRLQSDGTFLFSLSAEFAEWIIYELRMVICVRLV